MVRGRLVPGQSVPPSDGGYFSADGEVLAANPVLNRKGDPFQ